MKIAPKPDNEQQRLAALTEYEILDTEAERAFDGLTQLASSICGTEIALISLVDAERQWFKSKVGLDAESTHRDLAFCAHAILQDGIMEVPDARLDERFKDNPLVTDDPNIRFYAGAPLVTPNGHELGTLCTISSQPKTLSTQQRQALKTLSQAVVSQLELRKKNRELAQANKFKTDFLSYISHELRTPLNAILTFADLLANDQNIQKVSASAAEHINYIQQSGKRLLTTVNSVLDLNKIEAGKMELDLSSTDSRSYFSALFNILKAHADAQGVIMQWHVDAHLPEQILLDQNKFAQIANNVIGNAIKFTPAGKKVTCNASYANNKLTLVCQDEGIGISEEDQTKLFQEYYRTANASHQQGTGLGLTITQALLRLMDGKFVLSSELGQGTSINVTIPVDTASNEEAVVMHHFAEHEAAAAGVSKATLLVVEDNEINQAVMSSILSQWQVTFDIASNGNEALTMVAAKHYDLILMDIRLPDMDGLEVTRRIRQNDTTTPIVALTADVIDSPEQIRQSQMDDYLTKPIDQNLLLHTLNRLIG